MLTEIKIKCSGRIIKIKARKTNLFSRFIGLMFKNRNTDNLVFDFKRNIRTPIHSFFVFFPFLAIWIDDSGKIVDQKVIGPFRPRVLPKSKFAKLIEIPYNNRNKKIFEMFK